MVHPGVFHPGLFLSTQYLLEYLKKQNLKGATLLELGAGSGLISLFAANKGSVVTASDISQAAVENIRTNAESNDSPIEVVHSDLFSNIRNSAFDWVVINPPYYPKKPKSEKEFAWYCGENHEYFVRLFAQLPQYIHELSRVVMILSEDCAIDMIRSLARSEGLGMNLVEKRRIWGEWNYIFQIRRGQY